MVARVVHTPWITAVHPITFDKYTFRLSQHRRRGAIHLELRADSVTAPGAQLVVPRSRRGYAEFIQAAIGLINAARFDPKVNPNAAKPRYIWHEPAPDYPLRAHNAETVTLLLPRLLNPSSGRPLRPEIEAARAAAKAQGGTSPSHVATRARRRAEMMLCLSGVLTLLDPVRERLQDARKMKGYSTDETATLLTLADTIHNAASTWHRKVRETGHVEREVDQRIVTMGVSEPRSIPDAGPRQLRREVAVKIKVDGEGLGEPRSEEQTFVSDPNVPRVIVEGKPAWRIPDDEWNEVIPLTPQRIGISDS